MTTTLDSDDILTRLTQEELTGLTADLESGQTDPVDAAIAGGLGEIAAAVDPDALEAVSAGMLQRVWLSLTVPLLYSRQASGVPDKHLKEQTWAREYLARVSKGETRSRTVELVTRDTAPTDAVTRTKLNGLT